MESDNMPLMMESKILNRRRIRNMVKMSGLQMGSDYFKALSDKVNILLIGSIARVREDGKKRLGVEDL